MSSMSGVGKRKTYVPVNQRCQLDVGSLEVIETRLGPGVDVRQLGRLLLQTLDGINVRMLLLLAQVAPKDIG